MYFRGWLPLNWKIEEFRKEVDSTDEFDDDDEMAKFEMAAWNNFLLKELMKMDQQVFPHKNNQIRFSNDNKGSVKKRWVNYSFWLNYGAFLILITLLWCNVYVLRSNKKFFLLKMNSKTKIQILEMLMSVHLWSIYL